MKLEFSRPDFQKKTQIPSFIKIRPVGTKLFHADGQTDMTKLIVAFRNIVNAPTKNKTKRLNSCIGQQGYFKKVPGTTGD